MLVLDYHHTVHDTATLWGKWVGTCYTYMLGSSSPNEHKCTHILGICIPSVALCHNILIPSWSKLTLTRQACIPTEHTFTSTKWAHTCIVPKTYRSGTYLFPQEVGSVEYSHPRITILCRIYFSKPRVNWILDNVMTLTVTLYKAERNEMYAVVVNQKQRS